MRQELKTILGEALRYLAIATRERKKLTQKDMGLLLQMSESSYSGIETGATKCVSTLTATILLHMQDDPTAFLKMTQERFRTCFEKEG